jgi:hypothetical protein
MPANMANPLENSFRIPKITSFLKFGFQKNRPDSGGPSEP